MKGVLGFFFLIFFLLVFGGIGYLIYYNYSGDNQPQGMYGITRLKPSVCIPNPRVPDECLTTPTVGSITINVYPLPHSENDLPLKNVESGADGSYRIGLAPGQYCIIANARSCKNITIRSREWQEFNMDL